LLVLGTGLALNPTSITIGYGNILGFGLVRLNYFGTVAFFLSFPKSSMLFCVLFNDDESSAFLPVASY